MKKRCDKLIAKLREKNIDAAIITSRISPASPAATVLLL
jgi:ribosomal protein L12E/L44/L45/RPP1/RPP2